MRKVHQVFHMNTTKEIQDNLTFLNADQNNVVAYTLNGKAVSDNWERVAVIFNANDTAAAVTLPDDGWDIVVNEEKAGVDVLAEVSGNQVQVPAYAYYVLVKKAPKATLQVSYRTHVQNEGWQPYVTDGMMSGTKGKGLRFEGIEILLNNNTIGGNVEYRTHVQNQGWQKWVRDDAMSGTKGKSLRLESIQIRLVKK